MSILSDIEIEQLCTNVNNGKPMIEPFVRNQVRKETFVVDGEDMDIPVISYGLSSYGYDIRCSNKFKIFTNINSTVVDPKEFSSDNYIDHEGDHCIIPPNSFVLATSVEMMCIPDDVLVVCLGKSTYARCGIVVNVTPLEPGWCGNITLEFSNTTPLPAKIYSNEGVAQLIFHRGSQRCRTSYSDRGGKYQNQIGVTPPKV